MAVHVALHSFAGWSPDELVITAFSEFFLHLARDVHLAAHSEATTACAGNKITSTPDISIIILFNCL